MTEFRYFGYNFLRLTPFIVFVAVYFATVRDDGDVYLTTVLKCAPIVTLILFVFLKGFKLKAEYRYSRMIAMGLVFSCAGDLLLNLDLFPYGMASFGVAQIFYITAFGLTPLKFCIGLPLYVVAVGIIAYVFTSLDTVLKIGLPVYALLLVTMCWRCIVQAIVKGGTLAILCAVGSVLFVISDSLISVDMFLEPIQHSRLLIMTTYYAAQFLISLSTLKDVLIDGSKV